MSCLPAKPKSQKVQNLKIDSELGSYILSISINPNKIKTAEFTPKTSPCDYGYTKVCPPNVNDGCDEGMYRYCPKYEEKAMDEYESHNCNCLPGYLVTQAVSSGANPLGCGEGCVCLSENFRQCDNTTSESYLYLNDKKILDISTLDEVACNQDFPEKPILEAIAGIVPYKGNNELMVCGGKDMTGCRIWTVDGWVQSDTGFNRRWAAASETKSGLVITGGLDASSIKLTSTVIYSPMLTWTALPDLPIATYVHCQITVDNIVYVIGGETDSGRTGATFKLEDGGWSQLSSLKNPRHKFPCVEWDGGILAIAGWGINGGLSSVERYDLVSNEWSNYNEFPILLSSHLAAVWEDDLYVFGGIDLSNGWVANKVVYKLRTGNKTWEVVPGVSVDNYPRSILPAVITSNIHCNN